jgi:hypothetical protein
VYSESPKTPTNKAQLKGADIHKSKTKQVAKPHHTPFIQARHAPELYSTLLLPAKDKIQ